MTRVTHPAAIPIAGALAAATGALDLDYEQIPADELAAWRQRRDAQAIADQRDRDPRQEQVLAAGFPRRAVEAALVANEGNELIGFVRGWDPDRSSVLVLSGSKGVGKTVAAAWWALRRKVTPTFVRASEFARTSRYDDGSDGKSRWFGARALVLDDLGAEFADAKGSFLVDLDELIDTFYGDRRPLIITTNIPGAGFSARYGERVADRIRECGVFFEHAGPSLRGQP